MFSEEIIFGSSGMFEVLAVHKIEDQVVLSIQSLKKSCPCPACGVPGNKLHCYYYRKVKDLPFFNNRVFFRIKARKWYCQNVACNRKIFTERFDHYFKRYKRTSDRLREKLLKIGILMGGNAGEKLCRILNIFISSSSLIRLIHAQDVPVSLTVNAVGIDDWAFKKGINYGTVIVDLEQHKVIDLLKDREAVTVENWFKERQGVTVVTRDRFSRYATGVTNGVPDAVQVADRWHLLKNMGDALQKLLERERQQIITKQSNADQAFAPGDQKETITDDAVQCLSPRQELMQQVKKMHTDGVTVRAIARTLRISRVTVSKYIHLHELPKKSGQKITNLGRFNEYLQSRIQEDAGIETLQLFKEIKTMGYNGGRTILYAYLKPHTKQRNSNKLIQLPQVSWVASRVRMLLCKKQELLLPKDKALVDDICDKSVEVKEARFLANKFRTMMDNKQGHLLKEWIEEVVQSSIKELKSFATGLMSDLKAVENALTLPWSNGQVEGQVNKLKTIKRQMYGKAGFELLRKRVILHSAYYHQN